MLYLLVLLTPILLLAAWWLFRRERRRIAKHLRRQGASRNGRIHAPGGAAYPWLHFRHRGADVLVSVARGGASDGTARPPTTLVDCYLEGGPDRLLRIDQGGPPALLRGPRGLTTFQLGHPAFDERFVVRSDDQDFARRLLSSEVRHKLMQFDAEEALHVGLQRAILHRDGRPVPGSECPRLRVSINHIPREEQDYDRLIETAVTLCDRLQDLARDTALTADSGAVRSTPEITRAPR